MVKEDSRRRSLSRPRENRLRRFAIFKLRCWPEIQAYLRQGYPKPEIAKFIQDSRKECLHLSRESLITILYQVEREIEPIWNEEQVTAYHRVVQRKAREQTPELYLHALGFLAFERVLIEFQREKDQGETSKRNDEAIRTAKEVFAELAHAQIERNKKVPLMNLTQNNFHSTTESEEIFRKELADKFGASVGGVLANDESRRKVLETLSMVRNLVQGPIAEVIEPTREQ